MASTVGNVYAAMPKATGSLLRAPIGTTVPTNATAALDPAFVDMGYIGEDGFTESMSRDIDKKKAFGGATVKILQTDYTSTISFTFLESANADVLRAVYGEENVTVAGDNVTVQKNKKTLPRATWVIDTLDGDVGSIRTLIPNGQIISVDDIVKVHTDTIAYTVTIEAFEDEAGNNVYEFINRVAAVGGVPVISSLSPDTADIAGGDLITVNGTGFTGATAVNIDGVAVAEYTVISQNQVVFAAPADTAGGVPVTVVTPAGESAPVTLTYA